MSKHPPIFTSGNCKTCGGRWHLTDYCPYRHEYDLIVLSASGEALRPYPDSDMADGKPLGMCIAVHYICNGFVDLKEVSPTHNAIVCRSCHWRVVIPNSIETFGELRQWARMRGVLDSIATADRTSTGT